MLCENTHLTGLGGDVDLNAVDEQNQYMVDRRIARGGKFRKREAYTSVDL